MANIPAPIAAAMRAQGSPVPVSLLELQTPGGYRFFFSEMLIVAPSLLAQFDGSAGATGTVLLPYTNGFPSVGGSSSSSSSSGSGIGGIGHVPVSLRYPTGSQQPSTPTYYPWLIDPPEWTFTGTLTTPTSRCTLQNLSGDTVERDFAKQFAAANLWGSIVIHRLWLPAAEYALITVKGNVTDAHLEDDQMELTLRGLGNWSEIPAPDCTVDVNCGNIFGSQQCGSVDPTPCQNTWGTCSAQNRFKGVVTQWNTGTTNSSANAIGVAQPVPTVAANLRGSA